MRNPLIYILMCVLLSACTGRKQNTSFMEGGDTIRMSHAKLLTIIRHEGFTEAQIADPWNSGRTLHKYILITKGQSIPDEGAEGHTVVNLPLQSMLVSTAAHCALFGELGMQQCVTGVCEPEYIHQSYVSEGIRSGSIMDCGLASQPNVENIVNLSPDAILLSPFQGTTDYGKVSQLGIPIIELADYMELSPLGRAEWIKFYGMLVGKEELADRMFAKLEREYNDCIQLAKAQKSCPTVMMDKMVQATWYVPGGQSTMGQMLKDAKCRYVYADDEHSGSLTLSFEQVTSRAAEADLWLLRYSKEGGNDYTISDLVSENSRYSLFKAVKERRVSGCNTMTSNVFEETAFHPELLLRDLIIAIHPELKKQQRRYFFPL